MISGVMSQIPQSTTAMFCLSVKTCALKEAAMTSTDALVVSKLYLSDNFRSLSAAEKGLAKKEVLLRLKGGS